MAAGLLTTFEAVLGLDQRILDAVPAGVFLCSARGEVVRFNRAAAALWGRTPQPGEADERYSGALRLYTLDGSPMPRGEAPVARALAARAMVECDLAVERPDGTRVLVAVRAEPLTGANGKLQGAIACFHDITGKAGASAALGEKECIEIGLLAAIVESSDDAIISKNLDGIIMSWNEGARRVFGYTAAEAVGRPVTMLMPPERQNEEPTILRRIRSGERIDHYETVRQRKDGTLIDISLTVSPVKDAEGRIVGASKIARDISERKRADAQRELLLAELNHRVKNTLATVVSIAQQSFSKGGSPEEIKKSFSGRIRAMAQTHTRLAESNWSGASLRSILGDELSRYRDGHDRVRLVGPDVELSPKRAVMLGLAFHELTANAVKYGALSAEQGVVEVVWHLAPEGALTVSWQEAGGPKVAAPTRRGFGSVLLEQVLPKDLHGSFTPVFAEEGLHCEIVVPLADSSPGACS